MQPPYEKSRKKRTTGESLQARIKRKRKKKKSACACPGKSSMALSSCSVWSESASKELPRISYSILLYAMVAKKKIVVRDGNIRIVCYVTRIIGRANTWLETAKVPIRILSVVMK
jgi:hypothetical protein